MSLLRMSLNLMRKTLVETAEDALAGLLRCLLELLRMSCWRLLGMYWNCEDVPCWETTEVTLWMLRITLSLLEHIAWHALI
ncbi:hypothetical protein TNCT_600561 [Trichonephila clavata]|uniref:Uncharacterized protein n=1 Tax=Trichonephila clavata TaxID=2740835 RepID=A0A8X6HTQ5_TRICU|nr:hypothetical protein TNCT_600561 [Trichonephila clavata]